MPAIRGGAILKDGQKKEKGCSWQVARYWARPVDETRSVYENHPGEKLKGRESLDGSSGTQGLQGAFPGCRLRAYRGSSVAGEKLLPMPLSRASLWACWEARAGGGGNALVIRLNLLVPPVQGLRCSHLPGAKAKRQEVPELGPWQWTGSPREAHCG